MIGYDFKEFAKFNKSTNDKMNEIFMKISEKEWKTEFNGFYKSIYELCSHNYSADYNWFKRFSQASNFEVTNSGFFDKDYIPERNFEKKIFENIEQYIKMRNELDDVMIEFIEKMSYEDLNIILKISDSDGNIFELKMDDMIFHIFNHGIHHKGMISIYLDMLGIENEFN